MHKSKLEHLYTKILSLQALKKGVQIFGASAERQHHNPLSFATHAASGASPGTEGGED